MSDLSRVAELRMLGHEERAQTLLDALNQINRAFGHPEHAMPEPARQFTGMIVADASKVSPGEFIEAALHPILLPERAELEPKELPNGRLQVAA